MGVGDIVKASVDELREMMGSDCILNGTTALGKCSIAEMNPSQIRNILGDDFADELDIPGCIIEAASGSGIKVQDKITIDESETHWIVKRVQKTMANNVIIAERCLCIGEVGA